MINNIILKCKSTVIQDFKKYRKRLCLSVELLYLFIPLLLATLFNYWHVKKDTVNLVNEEEFL